MQPETVAEYSPLGETLEVGEVLGDSEVVREEDLESVSDSVPVLHSVVEGDEDVLSVPVTQPVIDTEEDMDAELLIDMVPLGVNEPLGVGKEVPVIEREVEVQPEVEWEGVTLIETDGDPVMLPNLLTLTVLERVGDVEGLGYALAVNEGEGDTDNVDV